MIDKLGRDITYLRISLTDKCNLRCRYCMPEEGVCKRSHSEMMNEDEVVTAVKVAASLGIYKVRLTGGEPLVKRNIVSICRRVAAVEGIREVCLTTNGILLPELGRQLFAWLDTGTEPDRCADCLQLIQAVPGRWTAEQLASGTLENYGRKLCFRCMAAEIKKRKEDANAAAGVSVSTGQTGQ